MGDKANSSQIPSFQETAISTNTSKRKRKEYSKSSIVHKHSIKRNKISPENVNKVMVIYQNLP